MRVLIVHCQLHAALELERTLAKGMETRIVTEQDNLGTAFSEFDPTHVLAGTNAAYKAAAAIIEKRGSDAKVTRWR